MKKYFAIFKNSLVWKRAFILLLALNMVTLAYVGFKFTSTNNHKQQTEVSKEIQLADKVAKLEMTTSQVNRLLHDYQKSDKYEIYIGDYVNFQVDYKAFFLKTLLTVKMTPEVLDDGNIQLNVVDIEAGDLKVSKEKLLTYVSNHVVLPEYIKINASKNH